MKAEYYNNILCVEGGWLVDTEIMSHSQLKHHIERKQFRVIRRGCRNTPALVSYDSLPQRFKDIIIEKYGDPYKNIGKYKFCNTIEVDPNAVAFYQDYRLADGRPLADDVQLEYATNAKVLNALSYTINDTKARRRAMGGSAKGIWPIMAAAVASLDKQLYPHTLPTNERRLRERLTKYLKEGYESLIHANFCNKNTEKLDEVAKLWALARWANQVDRVTSTEHLLVLYNEEADQKGWKRLKSAQTLHNFLHSEGIYELWYGHRYGELKAKEKFAVQHRTLLPTMRDSLWYSDGTKLNYFYLTEDGNIDTVQVYEVMDVYSEVLLGYHISKSEDYEAQYNAYRMALQFSGHKPYEIKFDNQGGHKKLVSSDLMPKLARLAINTAPYNGKSKTIESAFGRFQQQYLKKDWFFTGQNIQAVSIESKANMEFILPRKKELPTLAEIKKTYEKRRNEWNNAPHHASGIARIEMYKTSQNERAVKLSLTDMVELFWLTRQTPCTVHPWGIEFTEKKVKYAYQAYTTNAEGRQVPDVAWIRANVDQKYTVKFDPADMGIIYLYEQTPRGLAFVRGMETFIKTHRNIQEQEAWEAQYYADVDVANKRARIATRDKMEEILTEHGMSAEQQGLGKSLIAGVESGKKRKAAERKAKTKRKKEQEAATIGNWEKRLSNAVLVGDDDAVDSLLDMGSRM